MEAKELMIGDWYNLSVKEISINRRVDCFFFTEWGTHKWMQPIPLTKEILDANGFVANDKYAYLYRCGVYLLDIHYRIGEIDIYEEKGHYTSGYVCKHIKVDSFDYVHELQHALRLCGLTELADNFKLQA